MQADHGIRDERLLAREDSFVELEFRIREDSDYFDGHFPDFKLLPAVAQMDIISRFARRQLGISHFIPRIRRIKFSSPIYPGDRLRLKLQLDRQRSSISFELRDAATAQQRITRERDEALENALKYGASRAIHPEELQRHEYLTWENWESPDLRRDGHKIDIFHTGFENVMEFTGTPDGLELAANLVCAHGRLGVGGYHNDGLRTVDFKLWNMKAMDVVNCHERRIEFEAGLCRRALDMLSKGYWKFTGTVNHIYTMEEFDKANYDMENHTDNFIKGAVLCER